MSNLIPSFPNFAAPTAFELYNQIQMLQQEMMHMRYVCHLVITHTVLPCAYRQNQANIMAELTRMR